jgi:hypothetical protein
MDSLKSALRYRTIYRKYLQVGQRLRLYNVCVGKEQLEELKNMKKVKEPMLTAEEKASKINRQEIKGTGKVMTA